MCITSLLFTTHLDKSKCFNDLHYHYCLFQVAAYDFTLPVIINHIGAPSPAPTPFPPTPAPSNKNSLQHIINPKPQPFSVVTPRKHVIATALRQPLQLSTNKIEMFAPASFYDVSIQSGQMQSKVRKVYSSFV